MSAPLLGFYHGQNRQLAKGLTIKFFLDSKDEIILRALVGSGLQTTFTQGEIAAKSNIGRKTIGRHLKRLIKYGLVHHPNGPRGGVELRGDVRRVFFGSDKRHHTDN